MHQLLAVTLCGMTSALRAMCNSQNLSLLLMPTSTSKTTVKLKADVLQMKAEAH